MFYGKNCTLANKLLLLCSLFDDGKARYHKLCESISQFTVTQIGELFASLLSFYYIVCNKQNM